MSAREVLAYAITHAPRGQKGGPYEAALGAEPVASLEDAWRTPAGTVERARRVLKTVRRYVPTARVIRIVRKARPSEAEAIAVLRELVAERDALSGQDGVGALDPTFARARRVLAGAGPDPSAFVRAAMRVERLMRHGVGAGGALVAFHTEAGAYRKAGGK
jgi:hypothetical protein